MKDGKKIFNKYVKINCCPGCVVSIHIARLWMCVLFYFSFVCLNAISSIKILAIFDLFLFFLSWV